MGSFEVLLISLVLVGSETFAYQIENDQLDVEQLLKNPNELQKYIDCFLDRKPCTTLAGSYKDHIEDAVKTACSKCTNEQKVTFLKFIVVVQKTIPTEMEAFKAKYDPDGIYFGPLQSALITVSK